MFCFTYKVVIRSIRSIGAIVGAEALPPFTLDGWSGRPPSLKRRG
ncbi:hypothetical protein Y032_0101g3327, partial [Ancylostoma ceylanicum]